MKIARLLPVLLLSLLTAGCIYYPATVQVAGPGATMRFSVRDYPDLVPVTGLPVYYAPGVQANYFFYDGLYWVYEDDNWYASTWFDGPWSYVRVDVVPVVVLHIPVYYYRRPPRWFAAWHANEPPHWDQHWGAGWEQRHPDWRRLPPVLPPLAPRPDYQRDYGGHRYPAPDRQRELHHQNYRYTPRDPVDLPHEPAGPGQNGRRGLPGANGAAGDPAGRGQPSRPLQRPDVRDPASLPSRDDFRGGGREPDRRDDDRGPREFNGRDGDRGPRDFNGRDARDFNGRPPAGGADGDLPERVRQAREQMQRDEQYRDQQAREQRARDVQQRDLRDQEMRRQQFEQWRQRQEPVREWSGQGGPAADAGGRRPDAVPGPGPAAGDNGRPGVERREPMSRTYDAPAPLPRSFPSSQPAPSYQEQAPVYRNQEPAPVYRNAPAPRMTPAAPAAQPQPARDGGRSSERPAGERKRAPDAGDGGDDGKGGK